MFTVNSNSSSNNSSYDCKQGRHLGGGAFTPLIWKNSGFCVFAHKNWQHNKNWQCNRPWLQVYEPRHPRRSANRTTRQQSSSNSEIPVPFINQDILIIINQSIICSIDKLPDGIVLECNPQGWHNLVTFLTLQVWIVENFDELIRGVYLALRLQYHTKVAR